MITLIRTNSNHPHFQELVRFLDLELKVRDGEEHDFYAQFNRTDTIHHILVAYDREEPVACGAIKAYDSDTMEVKRMYVLESRRGEGIASLILKALEEWSRELNYERCLLETGINQPEAIRLYHKNHYQIIPNYGHYIGVENSICFEKKLVPKQ